MNSNIVSMFSVTNAVSSCRLSGKPYRVSSPVWTQIGNQEFHTATTTSTNSRSVGRTDSWARSFCLKTDRGSVF